MAILDFREIASPNRNFNSKKNSTIGASHSVDDFELFCQEFFTSVKQMKIFKSVSSGPDLGIDLGVTDTVGDRWLISCKHYAHSDKPVPAVKDSGVIERTIDWGCQGFIAFYTTVPSTTLDRQLSSADKFGIRVERYTKDRIEFELMASAMGTHIAARYFPISMKNHYRHLVGTLDAFSPSDVSIIDGVAKLGEAVTPLASEDPVHITKTRERLAYIANIRATRHQHKPYFSSAVQDAVELIPSHFIKDDTLPRHFLGFSPTWDCLEVAKERSLEKIYFIHGAWSFWDWTKANECLAQTLAIREYIGNEKNITSKQLHTPESKSQLKERYLQHRSKGLLNPGWLSQKLPEKMRDIIGRLFIYGQ
ncbi:hypothetical protein ACIOVF_03270 [Pseudomonas sp. NPDC087612]|uniref:hypothetical protein n=1 Tax=Pseudomonas sp. NPDC087612 TaxID=3364441 RepID=UPI003807E329